MQTDFDLRWHSLSEEDQQKASIQFERRLINSALKMIRQGKLPQHARDGTASDFVVRVLKEPTARYKQAFKEAEERYCEKIGKTPIDDDAWEQELRRRAVFDASCRPEYNGLLWHAPDEEAIWQEYVSDPEKLKSIQGE